MIHSKLLVGLACLMLVLTEQAIFAETPLPSAQQSPELTNHEQALSDTAESAPVPEAKTPEEIIHEMERALDQPEIFLSLMTESLIPLKNTPVAGEFETLQTRFLEHQFKTQIKGFQEGMEFLKYWRMVLEQVYTADELTDLRRVRNGVDSFLRYHKLNDPESTIAFCRAQLQEYRSLWGLKNTDVIASENQYTSAFSFLIGSVRSILSKLHTYEPETAKRLYPEIISFLDEYLADPLIPEHRKQSEIAEFANYIRCWGTPEKALVFLDYRIGNTPENKLHPRLLEVLFFLHQNQLGDREKAKHYLGLLDSWDSKERGWERHPRSLEWVSNNYFKRLPLSTDQLKRFAADHNQEMKEKTRHIGEKLL